MTVRPGRWISMTHDPAAADLEVLLARDSFAARVEVDAMHDARTADVMEFMRNADDLPVEWRVH